MLRESRLLKLKIKAFCVLKNPIHSLKYIALHDKKALAKLKEVYKEIYSREVVSRGLEVFGLSPSLKELVEEVYGNREIGNLSIVVSIGMITISHIRMWLVLSTSRRRLMISKLKIVNFRQKLR